MPYLHWFSDQHCSNCGRTSDYQLLFSHPLAVKDEYVQAGQIRWRESETAIRGLFSCNHCHHPHTLDFCLRPLTPIQMQQYGIQSWSGARASHFLNRLTPVLTFNSMSSQKHASAMSVTHEWGQRLNDMFEIVGRYPESTINPPSSLPSDLAAEFEELRQVAGSTRYTVVACRHLLEKACKKALGDAASSDKLAKLIDQAINRLETVKAITDWAHTIRVLGNEAVHGDGDSPTQAEAQEAVQFTTLFLELLFSYPVRIQTLRN